MWQKRNRARESVLEGMNGASIIVIEEMVDVFSSQERGGGGGKGNCG